MNCVNHPEAPAIAYCRECGKALCGTCRREADGTIYCEEHSPAPALEQRPAATARARSSRSPVGIRLILRRPPAPPHPMLDPGVSPGLAFMLGFIPGVGAIYNGQYVKGFIHVVIFGVLIAIVNDRTK